MTLFHIEPSLEQLLSDPVALAMMEAGQVDPVAFRQMLDRMSHRLRHDRLV